LVGIVVLIVVVVSVCHVVVAVMHEGLVSEKDRFKKSIQDQTTMDLLRVVNRLCADNWRVEQCNVMERFMCGVYNVPME
jgi:hypothetical protein